MSMYAPVCLINTFRISSVRIFRLDVDAGVASDIRCPAILIDDQMYGGAAVVHPVQRTLTDPSDVLGILFHIFCLRQKERRR